MAILSFVFCMTPARRHNDRRAPPSWDPANERTYSFRAWLTDISLWTVVSDLSPQQQAASIVLTLEGAAREHARSLAPAQLLQGGILNNQQVDPVTFLLAGLHERWGAVEEESRLAAMTEFLAFSRNPGET